MQVDIQSVLNMAELGIEESFELKRSQIQRTKDELERLQASLLLQENTLAEEERRRKDAEAKAKAEAEVKFKAEAKA